MKRHGFFLAIGLVVVTLFASVSSGLSLWLFENESGDKKASVEFQGKDSDSENKVIMDDIAENYFFGSNLKEKDYYDVYFFCQPALAYYNSSTTHIDGSTSNEYYEYCSANKKAATPMGYLEYSFNKVKNTSTEIADGESNYLNSDEIYMDNVSGYWGGRNANDTPTTNINNSDLRKPEPLGTSATVSPWGYKKIEHVYSQLNSADFSTIGDCFSTYAPSVWYRYFLGFTANQKVARQNSLRPSKTNNSNLGCNTPTVDAQLLDLTKPLSNYWDGRAHV